MAQLLQIEALCKNFGATHALSNADFDLRQGEIHALVGENGAGKSTLIRILAGMHRPDGGRVLLEGKKILVDSPREASKLGMAVIFQDFDLVPSLSIADNLLLGREPTRIFGIVDRREHRGRASAYLATVGLCLDPDTPVGQLTAAQRQLVAIAKVVSQDARILIMDEPTSALASDEIGGLLSLTGKLTADGTSVVFVSHKLDEVFEISDRITVLRDGRTVGTRDTSATSAQEIVAMMVGRELRDLYGKRTHTQNEPLLQVRGLRRSGAFDEIGFSMRKGEVLGLYGLIGAGRSAIANALFGLEPADAGELRLEGQRVDIPTPQDAIRLGLGMVPEDRKRQATFENMNVRENMSISTLDELGKYGLLDRTREIEWARSWLSRLNIRTRGGAQAISDLSGGNQQKVILCRWLLRQPRLLILDEPTAGIDLGARSEIYAIIDQMASQGVGVLLISSDLPEILGLSDRIVVIASGKVVGEFSHQEATEEKIIRAIHERRAAVA